MGLTNSLKESNALNAAVFTKGASSVVFLFLFVLYSTLHSIQVKKDIGNVDSQELFERKLVVYFVLHYSRKRFFRKGFDAELR